jgi:hypothetical protein
MITLRIDNDEETVAYQVDYLRSIIDRLDRGFTSGTNWDITGVDEEEDSEDEEVEEEEEKE